VLGTIVLVTTLPSLGIAAIADVPPVRVLSLGYIFVGSFFMIAGVAVGLRGPVRPGRRADGSVEGVRVAPPGERVETISASAPLVGVGFALVALGVALDPHTRLV